MKEMKINKIIFKINNKKYKVKTFLRVRVQDSLQNNKAQDNKNQIISLSSKTIVIWIKIAKYLIIHLNLHYNLEVNKKKSKFKT